MRRPPCSARAPCPHLIFALSYNHGQCCCAGSRIFVHEKIYDEFLKKFTDKTKALKLGDPFAPDSYQGPQVSQQLYDVRPSFSFPSLRR